MGYQQLTIDQINIRFDAAKAAIERIEKRALVEVVVVSVGLADGGWILAGHDSVVQVNNCYDYQEQDVTTSVQVCVHFLPYLFCGQLLSPFAPQKCDCDAHFRRAKGDIFLILCHARFNVGENVFFGLHSINPFQFALQIVVFGQRGRLGFEYM